MGISTEGFKRRSPRLPSDWRRSGLNGREITNRPEGEHIVARNCCKLVGLCADCSVIRKLGRRTRKCGAVLHTKSSSDHASALPSVRYRPVLQHLVWRTPDMTFRLLLSLALAALLVGSSHVLGQGDSKTCPLDGPLSCHSKPSPSTDSCCFLSPGGLLLQTQFWDTKPSTGPTDSWTIHGLWSV